MHTRAQMLARLRTLVGCKFTSLRGVRGLICEHGLLCLDKPAFVLFAGSKESGKRPMRDDQTAEILRLNEKFIEHQSQEPHWKPANDPVAEFMGGIDPKDYPAGSRPRTARPGPEIEYLE